MSAGSLLEDLVRITEPEWVEPFGQRLLGHFHEIVRAEVQNAVAQLLTAIPHPGPAVGLRTTIGEIPDMASTTLSVDVANEEVRASWIDDKNEPTTDIPAGAQIVFTSSDDTIVSVGASSAQADGATAPLSFSRAGNATLTASGQDADGNALPGFNPGTTDLVLTPGTAAGLMVSVDQAAPVEAPTPPTA